MPRLAQAARVTAEPYGWMAKWRERYGDVFSCHFPFYGRIVYVADPALVKQVFTGDAAIFHAGEANATALGDSLGENSLLTLDEGRHMSQRKLLLPPFHGQAVHRYVETMGAAAAAEVERWPVGRPFALRPRMQAITLDVILRAVFGVRDGERVDLFRRRIPPLGELSSVLDWLPFMQRELGGITPAARFRKALAAVDELLYAEIAERRESHGAEERADVLSLLLSARHENGSPMSDVELRDELLTLLTAGHETTATGLAWTFERLLRTPVAMGRLLDSLDDDDHLDAVVKEALRIRPVVGTWRASSRARSSWAAGGFPPGRWCCPPSRRSTCGPTSTPSRSSSAPSGSWTGAPSRMPGSRSAVVCGGASGRHSHRWR